MFVSAVTVFFLPQSTSFVQIYFSKNVYSGKFKKQFPFGCEKYWTATQRSFRWELSGTRALSCPSSVGEWDCIPGKVGGNKIRNSFEKQILFQYIVHTIQKFLKIILLK